MTDTNSTTTVLRTATQAGASDVFIIAGLPLSYKVHGVIQSIG